MRRRQLLCRPGRLRESGPTGESKEAVDGEPLAPKSCEKEENEKPIEVKKEDQANQQVEKEPLVTVPAPGVLEKDKKEHPEEKPKRRRKHRSTTGTKKEGKKPRREKKKKKEDEPKAVAVEQEARPILAKNSLARGSDPTPHDLGARSCTIRTTAGCLGNGRQTFQATIAATTARS